ncbi:YcjF family protein [Polynucleobacter sp.]|uniref:YcjF family protein n=1 Tax=Polynucleobacter sp. TaxID=2029855 RepID=UPI0025D0E1CD|nr:DUF697 domain-containing protein [Polynucleobacter sp.]
MKSKESAEEVLKVEIDEVIDADSVESSNSKSYRHLLANQTVKNWSQWATVAGFIPVPYVDATAIAALQTKMAYELCKIYDVPFEKEAVKTIIGSLAGGGITTVVGGQLGGQLVKGIPYVGQALSVITQPAAAYAYTYAMGSIFVKHFETNGNLLNLEAAKFKDMFKEQVAKAKSFFSKKKGVKQEGLEPEAQQA